MDFESETSLIDMLVDEDERLIGLYKTFSPHHLAFRRFEALRSFVNRNQQPRPIHYWWGVVTPQGISEELAPPVSDTLCRVFLVTHNYAFRNSIITEMWIPRLDDLIPHPRPILTASNHDPVKPSYFQAWLKESFNPLLSQPSTRVFFEHIRIHDVGLVRRGMTASCSLFMSVDEANRAIREFNWNTIPL